MVFAVVTGGGTSGHVIPAQAILEGLVEAGHPVEELRYVGARRGVETVLMANSAIECEFLPISGLQRSISLRSLRRNLALPFRLMRSAFAARALIKKWQPRVVVSVGGYASEPMSAAASRAGIPLVCVSYDRTPGLATRRQARKAAVSAVAFADSGLPRAVTTGAPVRAELRHLDVAHRRDASRDSLGIPRDAVVVAVTGGSLGSAVLNSLVKDVLQSMSVVPVPVAVYHVCGERNLSDPEPVAPPNVWYRRVGYESRMADVYSSADVLIARAGASTIAEVATVGVASVIVPWAGSADNHQAKNAAWLGDENAAIVRTEDDCAAGRATQSVVELLQNSQLRGQIAQRAFEMGAIHRSDALIRTIENAAL